MREEEFITLMLSTTYRLPPTGVSATEFIKTSEAEWLESSYDRRGKSPMQEPIGAFFQSSIVNRQSSIVNSSPVDRR
jgi:hypothetical protein